MFQDFIEFFLPQAYNLIDFGQPVEFLEQELHKIISDKYKKGKVINDKLVKVRLKNGEEKWILIHIEVQSSYDSGFAERMFTYFYRIYDRYDQKITAIAIYTGDKVAKNYDTYEYKFLGTENIYKFNAYRISSVNEASLLASKNPFSLVVLASQYLLKSKDDYDKRFIFKQKLIKLAKERNYTDAKIINLIKFIDLLLQLPEKLELKFEKEVIETYLKTKNMVKKRSDSFANQLCLAVYGETLIERSRKISTIEKTLTTQNLLKLKKLSVNEIADAIDEPIEFVEKIQQSLKKD